MLGIRANAFFSRRALEELCGKGFADPTKAHETTLLRASFVLSRHRDSVSYRKVIEEHPQVRMAVRYDVCKSLHDRPIGDDWALFAPDACTCLTAPHSLRLDADWLGPARETGAREPERLAPSFLAKVRTFLARV